VSQAACRWFRPTRSACRWRTRALTWPWPCTCCTTCPTSRPRSGNCAASPNQAEPCWRPRTALPTWQTGAALLGQEFANVTLHTLDVPLSIPIVQPVIGYVASIREPILASLGVPLDFDAVLDDIAVKVEQDIQALGSFRATTHMGVFVCG
jgi:hypothetical protein